MPAGLRCSGVMRVLRAVLQLKLDSEDFGKQIQMLGVDATEISAYQRLLEVTTLQHEQLASAAHP